MNEDHPTAGEIESVLKSFKDNESGGTDNLENRRAQIQVE